MELVDAPHQLEAACRALQSSSTFYLDTEFNSDRGGTELCLIQVSAGNEVFLVDPVRLTDLTPLAEVLSGADRTWVLHAGQQDVPLLTDRLGIDPPRLFDTQIAWAMVSIEHSTSLSYLKYRLLGLRGEKAHQADDWRRRPLPEGQLAYAAEDVEHLPALYRALLSLVAELDRTELVYAASSECLLPLAEAPEPLDLASFRNAWQLEPAGQSTLLVLIDWYNGLNEEERDSAPDPKGLFVLASRRPRSLEELSGLRAVPKRATSRFGKVLLSLVQKGIGLAKHAEFVAIDPPPYATVNELLAGGWLEAARAELCVELKLAPELVLPARVLRRLRDCAVRAGQLGSAADGLTGFRRELLLEPLSKKLAQSGTFPRS